MAPTPQNEAAQRIRALRRVSLRTGDNHSLDAQCTCGLFIRSTQNKQTNLLELVEAVLTHRQSCSDAV